MSSLWTNRAGKNFRLTRAGNMLACLGFGAFAAPRATDERSLDYAYAEVLSGSGGKSPILSNATPVFVGAGMRASDQSRILPRDCRTAIDRRAAPRSASARGTWAGVRGLG